MVFHGQEASATDYETIDFGDCFSPPRRHASGSAHVRAEAAASHAASGQPGQRILVVNVEGYVCLVPFVESDDALFLKTVIPSRKMTKRHLGVKKHETD